MSGWLISSRAFSGFTLPPVLNPDSIGCSVVGHFAQCVSNERVRFLCLCGGCIAPGADGPYRLVRDHCFLQFLWTQTGETAAQLNRQYFFHIASVALFECFSNANDGTQLCLERRAHLAIDHFVSLAKQRAAFAVPEHDVMDKQVPQKRSADLAGKGAALLPIHILRADLDVLRSAQRFAHFCNCGEWRNDHHFDISYFADVAKE